MTSASSPLWKRLLRLSIFGITALTALFALALLWVHFSNLRAWTTTEKDLLARGEKLTLVELAPPKVPDEKNFFADPIWAELSDLVEAPRGDGFLLARQPRLPEGKRLLDAIDSPLPADLVARSHTLLSASDQPKSDATCLAVARAAERQLLLTSDPAKRTALAQLILDVLAPGRELRQRIETLLGRPEARFPVDYDAGLAAPLPHLTYLLKIDQAYTAAGRAHLIFGQSNEAVHDILLNSQLADHAGNEPLMISALVKVSIESNSLYLIKSGIRTHAWTESDLLGFEAGLDSPNFPATLAQALRGDRGAFNQLFLRRERIDHNFATKALLFPGPDDAKSRLRLRAESLFTLAADRAFYNRTIQGMVDALSSPGGIPPSSFAPLPRGTISHLTHRLSISSTDGIRAAILKVLSVQDEALKTRIACALERYWLKHRSYPDALIALVPDYLPKIPPATLANQAFHYRREAPDKFRLWSNGWNETDEQGTASETYNDYTGDWVWDTRPGAKR